MTSISDIAAKRYTCKEYDPNKKIPQADLEQLYKVLQNSPSSVNSQPWHFVIVESDEAKAKILPAIFEFNQPRITKASHVVLFLARNEFSDAYLKEIVDQEDKDQRFPEEEMKAANDQGRRYFVDLNSQTEAQLHDWQNRQVYIALGNLLLAAAALNIDSTPIEGFDAQKLDEILNLKEKGFRSLVVASLGYRSEEDFNAKLPKSRLPFDELFTIL
ncbi:oxygen-insensitive NAD(P)H nitroreductase [Ignatzschineria ureiclastica]|uniref:Oxygen-insensitive NAD(P)H nitroreductase n=1 Tax=Ignatzschineria ureiclastica TaxID=472582 RepID=A0A2U2ADC1_9GAMM|nr:oxygen-insensitive NAD(P)H nitroreductase [Ignatzschineria ureiclastica]PWD80559.1 oxygen-insensitive NAD(P)H nitroreductase [Ignatzschineria ureiclastica]GHA02562.1 NAD(P)H nitroreductase [Ignatzschineria ureiclastica]